jgi:flagellar protein FlgJ
MQPPIDTTRNLAIDANSLNDLKRATKDSSPESIKAAARQFESLLTNMMLKSMRDASPQDGIFDNEQSRSFTAMLDQQLSQNLASRGMGLADVIAKQLSKNTGVSIDSTTAKKISPIHTSATSMYESVASLDSESPSSNTEKISPQLELTSIQQSYSRKLNIKNQVNDKKSFKDIIREAAEEASAVSGIPSHYLMGQAALESGWGQHEIMQANGAQSFNLFGIKASNRWKGKVASTMTTEYINGEKQTRVEKFKAYNSYAESFKDFTNLIRNNPRYKNVIGNGQSINEYAQAIQKSGYATDPQYANKLAHLIRVASAS